MLSTINREKGRKVLRLEFFNEEIRGLEYYIKFNLKEEPKGKRYDIKNNNLLLGYKENIPLWINLTKERKDSIRYYRGGIVIELTRVSKNNLLKEGKLSPYRISNPDEYDLLLVSHPDQEAISYKKIPEYKKTSPIE